MARALAHTLLFATLGLSFVLARPSPALADSFVPVGTGGSVQPISHRVLVSKHGQKLTVVDDTLVLSRSTSSVWLRAFPSEPNWRRADPAMFDSLETRTTVREPHNQTIRRNLFGPSVVTVLTKKLGDGARIVPPPGPRKEHRSLEISNVTFFSGKVFSSTITRTMILPQPLAAWLSAHGVQADEELKMALSAQLNRGWIIMGATLEDRAPSADLLARVGPIRFELSGPNIVYPIMRHATQSGPAEIFDFYLLDSWPMASPAHTTIWNTRPWEVQPEEHNVFLATYSSEIEPHGVVGFELKERFGITLPSAPHLVRSRLVRAPNATWDDIELGASRDVVKIPGGTRRGSPFDLFLCVVLGLAPLIYTPESWFLIWLVNAAKERARKEGSAFGVGLWAMYALAVALFWVVTLEGSGRIAAVLPFLIGVGRLAIPYTDREPARVRAAFKTKKKA